MLDRNEIQQTAANLIFTYKRILLEFATGVGKTKAFIMMQENIKNSKVLIVISERLHKNNWIAEYIKHDKQDLLANVTFTCYNSLHKYKNKAFDIVCLDEVHRITPKRLEHLQEVKYEYIVGLSATVGYRVSNLLTTYFGEFYKYRLTLNTAIENKIVPEPIFYLHKIELDNTTSNELLVVKRGKHPLERQVTCSWENHKKCLYYPKYEYNTTINIICTQKQKLDYYDAQIDYYKYLVKKFSNKWHSFKLNKLGLDRKNYLASLKTHYVEDFLKKFDKRYICFCNDINQLNALGKPEFSAHSKKAANEQVVENFNNGVIDKLFVVKMMQEGQNLNNIEASVIIQLDSTSRSMIQKSGRALRAIETPEIHIFYVAGTSDETYLQTSIADINKEFIKVYNEP